MLRAVRALVTLYAIDVMITCSLLQYHVGAPLEIVTVVITVNVTVARSLVMGSVMMDSGLLLVR